MHALISHQQTVKSEWPADSKEWVTSRQLKTDQQTVKEWLTSRQLKSDWPADSKEGLTSRQLKGDWPADSKEGLTSRQ